ncbi:MAG: hypothetical protein Q9178_001263 [Gyalolechia marmorata]
MRLLLTSLLLSLPLASLASLEGGGAGAEPTTTLYSTSTQTLTRTLAGNTVTSTLPSGESTPPVESAPSATSTSNAEPILTTTTSESPVEEAASVTSPVIPSPTTSLTDLVVSTTFGTSANGVPYPTPGSSDGGFGTGTAAPTGTGAPFTPAPPGIEPFQGAGSKLGGQETLVAVAAVLIAGLAVF